MVLDTALALLVAWVLGMAGVYPAGQMVHVLLLVGLLLLLIAFMKGRDAALRQHDE